MRIEIKAQQGAQEMFLDSLADIAIYGGAAGGGKTYALLLEPLRHISNSAFGGIIFRKNTTQIRNEGGLWTESLGLYKPMKGHPRQSVLEWHFPSSMRMKFAHLEHDLTMFSYQGAQIPYIGWDELTHFSAEQFFYLLSRNRSSSKVPGYVRATCNPDPDSWVADFISWWIDQETGYPILERAGKLRWYIRRDDVFIWADHPDELKRRYGKKALPKSVTFIPSTIEDNKILMENDPAYLANLDSLSKVDRMRLRWGNWKIRASAGNIFRREWFPVVEAIPSGWTSCIRAWDRAATKVNASNKDPDWTRGLKMYKYPDGSFCVGDLKSIRDTPGQVEDLIKNVASQDGHRVRIVSQQDPGSAGVTESLNFVKMLKGFDVRTVVISKDKVTRAKPVSAQSEVHNIKILRAPWNESSDKSSGKNDDDDGFFKELEDFPDGRHDDICLGAGTKIATQFGDIDIENIKVGDFVLTPLGLKKVLFSKCTGLHQTFEIFNLRGTKNHPVFQNGKGFISLDSINGALLNSLSWKYLTHWMLQKQLALTENSTEKWVGKEFITFLNRIPIREGNLLKVCMLQFMKLLREKKFKKAFTFIIKIVTHLIITLKIWSVYRLANTARFLKKLILNKKSTFRKLEYWQQLGINPKKVVSGIQKTLNLESLKRKFVYVKFVQKNLNLFLPIRFFAPIDVLRLETEKETKIQDSLSKKYVNTVKLHLKQFQPETEKKQEPVQDSVPRTCGVQNVYNLKIDQANCYYANGILVGNCDVLSLAFNELCESDSVLDHFRTK